MSLAAAVPAAFAAIFCLPGFNMATIGAFYVMTSRNGGESKTMDMQGFGTRSSQAGAVENSDPGNARTSAAGDGMASLEAVTIGGAVATGLSQMF